MIRSSNDVSAYSHQCMYVVNKASLHRSMLATGWVPLTTLTHALFHDNEVLFLFSDDSRSIVYLYVRSGRTNTAYANIDSVVERNIKYRIIEFANAQTM